MPEGYEGTVRVYAQATVAESKEKFWTGIKSDVMTLTFKSNSGNKSIFAKESLVCMYRVSVAR